MGLGALFFGRLETVSAGGTQRRMIFRPNTAFGALDFHGTKIQPIEVRWLAPGGRYPVLPYVHFAEVRP
jgi:hypothetical protein